MKKIIRTTDEKRQIVQVTVSDECWYLKPTLDAVTGIPAYTPVPSVTWIAGHYPKGIGFYKWLADKGWDEAEAVKNATGDKGSIVHLAIEKILNGEEFRIDTKVQDKSRSTEQEAAMHGLTYEELLCVKSFIDWKNETNPEVIATEITIFSDIHGYAGTVDLICKIDDVLIVDFKTSKQVWKEHELQISAYRMAVENGENPIMKTPTAPHLARLLTSPALKTAILQVGYDGNKPGYKIWKAEVNGNTPGFTKRDFPIVLSPARKAEPAESVEPATETPQPPKKERKT